MNIMAFLRGILCKCEFEDNKRLIAALDSIKASRDNYLAKCVALEDEIKTLQNIESIPPAPEWLNQSSQAYAPSVQYYSGGLHNIQLKPQDIYLPDMTLSKLMETKGWKSLDNDRKLNAIWQFVISELMYRYDDGEAWRFPGVTYRLGFGDCDDGSILFVSFCKLCGIKSDSVFNVCGYYNTGTEKLGHSYPIAKMSDGKWYIFETTLTKKPANPLPFKETTSYGCEWGAANWEFQGKIIDRGML